MKSQLNATGSAWKFFLLVMVLSVPFLVAGAFVERFLPTSIPINLPFAALMVVCPISAGLILTYRASGRAGVKRLLDRVFDFRRIKARAWYLPVFLLMPLIVILEFAWMKLSGFPFPELQIPWGMAPLYFVIFFIGAIGEELGWQGYACDPLQERWGALGGSLIMGIIWAVWHIIPNLQAHHPLPWLAAQFANTVALRVLIVWLYNNTGKSVFAAISFHAMVNVSNFMFPNYGSFFDPLIAFVLTALIALIAIAVWGPKTLASYRFSKRTPSSRVDIANPGSI